MEINEIVDDNPGVDLIPVELEDGRKVFVATDPGIETAWDNYITDQAITEAEQLLDTAERIRPSLSDRGNQDQA